MPKLNEIYWDGQIERAAKMISDIADVHVEIVQKKFPAEGVIYARLYTDDGREEWTLLDPSSDSDYDKAFATLSHSAKRLKREDVGHGF